MFSRIIRKITGWFGSAGIEISYSRVNTYRTCPWKYKLVYEDGLHVPPTPYISLGLSVHRALDDFHKRKAASLEELMESYNASWVNEGFVSPQQTQEFYERGQTMLESYWKSSAGNKTEILYLEQEFKFPLGRNTLRGMIDRIDRHPDGAIEIIDYKTHAELWKQDKVDSDLQLSLYALACRKALVIQPAVLSYYFLARNCKLSTSRSQQQLDEAVRIVTETADKIQRRDFIPNRTHCYRCDFKKTCAYSTAEKGRVRQGEAGKNRMNQSASE
jgi:RecB family exonuclease